MTYKSQRCMSEFVSYCLSDYILTSTASRSVDTINIELASLRALYIIKLL